MANYQNGNGKSPIPKSHNGILPKCCKQIIFAYMLLITLQISDGIINNVPNRY